jgi:hypothetical protein
MEFHLSLMLRNLIHQLTAAVLGLLELDPQPLRFLRVLGIELLPVDLLELLQSLIDCGHVRNIVFSIGPDRGPAVRSEYRN